MLVRGHPGWAGHVDTSYDARAQPEPVPRGEHAPGIYDAREQVPNSSDALLLSNYLIIMYWDNLHMAI